jgi:hypothetical protein
MESVEKLVSVDCCRLQLKPRVLATITASDSIDQVPSLGGEKHYFGICFAREVFELASVQTS